MCTTRKQRAGESIPIFAENISQLVDKAYPDGAGFNAQVRRELTVDLFRNGLKMSIREQLRHKTKPNSLHEAIQEAIEEDEAQNEIAREKLSSAQELIRVDESTLRSSTQLKIDWGILVYVNLDTKIVRSDLGNYEKCTLGAKMCEGENSTLIWDDPEEFHCPYESAGSYRAIVSDTYIVVKNLQAAFIFRDDGERKIEPQCVHNKSKNKYHFQYHTTYHFQYHTTYHFQYHTTYHFQYHTAYHF
ncbi:hypothetical protein GPALN_003319 [Globodera pallida]|nr:hypothetical protein GPALN_003319 [Globodera pallida]